MRLVLRSRRIGLRARLVSARGLAAVVISISPVPVVVIVISPVAVVVIVISPVAAVVIIVVGVLVAVFISVAIARYGFLSRFTAILIVISAVMAISRFWGTIVRIIGASGFIFSGYGYCCRHRRTSFTALYGRQFECIRTSAFGRVCILLVSGPCQQLLAFAVFLHKQFKFNIFIFMFPCQRDLILTRIIDGVKVCRSG
ncbi:MAG: hypothetical protein LOD92_02855 [Bacillales bacterium]